MKRAAIILVLLVFIGGCYASGQYDQPANEPPEYLPLPEKANAELAALGIQLPSLFYNFTPPIDGFKGQFDPLDHSIATLSETKRRLTKEDIIQSTSEIWDVYVEATVRHSDKYGYYLWIRVRLKNQTDLSYDNALISLSLNPQLEYHYEFARTTCAWHTKRIVPLGDGKMNTEYISGLTFNPHFPLPRENPFHLSAPELKQKFDIFFRDLYIFTEWDGGREVLLVDKAHIDFQKDFDPAEVKDDIEHGNEDGTEEDEDIANED